MAWHGTCSVCGMLNRILLGVGFSTLALLVACSGGTATNIEESSPENPTVVKSAALEITATLVSATLGDDCGSGASAKAAPASGIAADCAPEPEGKSAGGCGGGAASCQQSNMQLSFVAKGTGPAAKVSVLSVRLLKASDASELSTLQSREPETWNGTKYSAWDESIAPGATVNASYKLSAPDWSTISGGKQWSSYSEKYLLEVVLTVDGVQRTLRSNAEIYREPSVVT